MARLLPPLILVLALAITISFATAADNVPSVCAGAEPNRDICTTVLSSVPVSHDASVHQLAKIALNLTSNNATAAASYLSDLVEGLVEDPKLLACLTDCLDEYVDAVDQLTDAEPAVDQREYKEVIQWVQAAQASVGACQDGCKVVPADKTSKLAKMNTDVTNLCSITVSIVKLLGAH